ncbi:MAG: class I SAM-dependent methyltransferase [Calothrix sp. C42_A2020_038]|nr:class I SAM-dependent methyltransferase [Calothrix sp. C42_A2020_038]
MEKDFYYQYAAVEDKHWWFIGRRRILENVIRQLKLPENAKILEAGCGTGGNLPMLSRFGEVSAMEIEETARIFANERQITTVKAGSLPDKIPFEYEEYDLIVAFDVLEHLDDDLTALKALRSHLKPSGWLVLTVPAFQFLWSHHDDINHHRRRYRLKDLEHIVRKANFTVHYSSYFNFFLFPLVTVVRFFSKILRIEKKSQISSDLTLPSEPVNKFLSTLFAQEQHLINKFRLPFGVSALLVGQKD